MLKPNVLRKKKDFSSIYNKGKSFGGKYVVVFYRKNNLDYNRTAFLASKKVGKSVKRNKARRRMKESFREIEKKMKIGYDIIIIARNTINDAKYKDIKKSMETVFLKIKLLNGDNI